MITLDQISAVYQKVKSDIYYSNNIINKKKIVDFEAGDIAVSFNKVYFVINDGVDYSDLLDKISILIFPKNIDKEDGKNEGLVINSKMDKEQLKSVNFFIDCPIEILLIDAIWSLVAGFSFYSGRHIDDTVSFGNVLDNHKLFGGFSQNEGFTDSDNKEDIKFNKGISFFKPYFRQYSTWRNKCFFEIKKVIKEHNVILINYDIKQFYYNYLVSFNDIAQYINYNGNTNLSIIMERIYEKYQSILVEYKKINIIKDRYVLPIGLFSSRVISNFALSKYDYYMKSKVGHLDGHYGRYVDDMLLVLPWDNDVSEYKDKTIEDILNDIKFVNCYKEGYEIPPDKLQLGGIYCDLNEEGIKTPRLMINKDKIDVYFFDKNEVNILSQIHEAKMLMSTSDVGYAIDDEFSEKQIIDDLFRYKNSKYGFRVSDLKTASIDRHQLSITLTKLINLYKNVNMDRNSKEVKSICATLRSLFSTSGSMKYFQSFEKLFTLFAIFGLDEMKMLEEKLLSALLGLKSSFSEGEYVNASIIESMTKNSLKRIIGDCKEYANALIFDKNNPDDFSNFKKWIDALMINKALYFTPLIHLSDKAIDNVMTLNFQLDFELSEEKLKFVPYWISFQEFYFYKQMRNIKKNSVLNMDTVFDEYFSINNANDYFLNNYSGKFIRGKSDKNFFFEESKEYIHIYLKNQLPYPIHGIDESDEDHNNRFIKNYKESAEYSHLNIGVVSIPINIDDILEIQKGKQYWADYNFKLKVNKILNEAIKSKITHLIFPELSIPPLWVNDLLFFCNRHKIQMTFGMQYMFDCRNRIYNTVVSLYPFNISGVHRFVYVSMREKRYYPYSEKAYFEINNFNYEERKNFKPQIVSFKGVNFSDLLCYELTSIMDRAKLKNEVDVLFVPVLNKDTNYFSSIVDSTARELYCYVCMANTSIFGDSRITGPFSTEEKDIVRVKGGNNLYCVIGELNIKELIEKRKQVSQEYLRSAEKKKKASSHLVRTYKPLSAGWEVEEECLEDEDLMCVKD